MDKFTKKTKKWLENRYRKTSKDGIYYAHQPIYGFRKNHCDPHNFHNYNLTYQIIKALTLLNFNSLLDVGASEGFTAYIIKQFFNVDVECTDISKEACKHAQDIFNIKSKPGYIQNLPFNDDIVLCSETLEHVTNLFKAINEILRIAKKAVIITVPHEPIKLIKEFNKNNVPHRHIHCFNKISFNFLMSRGYKIIFRKSKFSALYIPILNNLLIDAEPIEDRNTFNVPKFFKIFIDIYNISLPLLRRIFQKQIVSFLIKIDHFFCKFAYGKLLFIILKDNNTYRKKRTVKIRPCQILNISVPYYYPLKQNIQ